MAQLSRFGLVLTAALAFPAVGDARADDQRPADAQRAGSSSQSAQQGDNAGAQRGTTHPADTPAASHGSSAQTGSQQSAGSSSTDDNASATRDSSRATDRNPPPRVPKNPEDGLGGTDKGPPEASTEKR